MVDQPGNGSSGRLSRRRILQQAGTGFGYLALAGMLGRSTPQATGGTEVAPAPGPLAPKVAHFAPKAKRIIFLFMQGAASQMDTWEYKPRLQQDDGKVGPGGGTLTGSKFRFAQHGRRERGSQNCTRTPPSTSTSSASFGACTPTPRRTRRR